MSNLNLLVCLTALTALTSILPSSGYAQGKIYAYPTAGQSQKQQQQDQLECYQWSVQQSGFDPAAPQPQVAQNYASAPPKSSGPLGLGSGGFFGDAAKGAAIGAIGGAIGGNAGKGAAIGAGVSALFGGIKRSSRRQEEAEWSQQQQAQAQQQQQQLNQQHQVLMQEYNRAYSACMSARNYNVQ